ncbi:MAG TPA: hypothetical protein VIA10_06310 [Gaiellaceae bacterium]|jgi:hypothetical protein
MKDVARTATPRSVREAIADILDGSVSGAMLEATRHLPVEKAHELATHILIEKRALERVKLWTEAGWLHLRANE